MDIVATTPIQWEEVVQVESTVGLGEGNQSLRCKSQHHTGTQKKLSKNLTCPNLFLNASDVSDVFPL